MSTLNNFNDAVIALNKQKKDDGFYSEGTSPAVLRDMLLLKLSSGDLKNDISTLKSFFKHSGDDECLEFTIRKNTDRFKSVQNLIIEETKTPSQSNINLLSILIDFQPRPFDAWRKQGFGKGEAVRSKAGDDKKSDETNPKVDVETGKENSWSKLPDDKGEMTDEDSATPESPITISSPKTTDSSPLNVGKGNTWKLKDKKSLSILSGALVLTILMAFYSWPDKQCMYWNGERYIAIHCDERDAKNQIMALDDEKLKHFQRITQTDTLTDDHVNKVWYSKINNEVEFFTHPGLHPVHQHRSLKAATQYILESYAISKARKAKGAID